MRTITKMKAQRMRLGLTQAALAERIGVTQPRISAWENGKADIPAKRQRQIARILEIDGSILTEAL